MGFIPEKLSWFNFQKINVINHISKLKKENYDHFSRCRKNICQNLTFIPDFNFFLFKTNERYGVLEGREFGGRETREGVIDRVKVRLAEGLSEDSGIVNGEEEKTDVSEVELTGLGDHLVIKGHRKKTAK